MWSREPLACNGGELPRFQVVDATTESHIYQVKLRDSLVSSLQFSKAKNAELAWLDGEIIAEEHLAPDGSREDAPGGCTTSHQTNPPLVEEGYFDVL